MMSFEQAMRDVLDNARYDHLTGRSVDFKKILTDAIERAVRFIVEHLNLRLPDFANGDGRVFIYIFVVIGVLLLLTAAGLVIRWILRSRKAPVPHDLSDLFEEIAQKHYTLDQLLLLQKQHADAGDWRSAVRYRYIAVLVCLDDRHILRIEKSKTNDQLYKALAAKAPSLAPAFAATIEYFHYAWFGGKPVATEPYAHFLQQSDTLLNDHLLNSAKTPGGL